MHRSPAKHTADELEAFLAGYEPLAPHRIERLNQQGQQQLLRRESQGRPVSESIFVNRGHSVAKTWSVIDGSRAADYPDARAARATDN